MFSLFAVVVELVEAAVSEKSPHTNAERVKYLTGGLYPHLQKMICIGKITIHTTLFSGSLFLPPRGSLPYLAPGDRKKRYRGGEVATHTANLSLQTQVGAFE